MFALVGMVEAEHDVVIGNPGREEFVRDSVLCAVVLNPDFAVANVHVDDAAMHPSPAIPTRIEQLVMALRVIKDRLDSDLTVRRWRSRVLADNPLDDLRIRGYVSHWMNSSFLGSNTAR